MWLRILAAAGTIGFLSLSLTIGTVAVGVPMPNASTTPKPTVKATGGRATGRVSWVRSDKGPAFGSKRRQQQAEAERRLMDAIVRCLEMYEEQCLLLDSTDLRLVLDYEEASSIAQSLVVQLDLPDPTPHFGPDPKVNEWKMLAVGFPIWLWTGGPRTLSATETSSGVTFNLTARWRSTTFTMGDGRTVTCTAMTKYSNSVKPGSASPNCGYVYTNPSLPGGSYTVRATTNWDVAWSALGYSGVLPATHSGSRLLPIGELSALNR